MSKAEQPAMTRRDPGAGPGADDPFREAAEAVVSKIRQAQVVFLDDSGEPVFTLGIGRCRPGDTITCTVPDAGTLKFDLGP